MHIILMRHGKPIMSASRWLAPCDMDQWIAQYDQAGVHTCAIPAATLAAAGAAGTVFASTLPRAQSSARALGHAAARLDALFCEAALPHSLWRYPRLPPVLWAALFRLAWLCGYARGADALAVVRLRAKAATVHLVSAAAQGPVLLVGHGIMNRLIAHELRASGWTATSRHRSGHWGTAGYQSRQE